MQCFQKDPNLRVSARKLLKHPWIVNARRSDSVVPKKPTEYNEAVKSVQQWNEALKSPNAGSLRRASRPMSSSPIPGRREPPPILETPARGPLNLAKPRFMTEQFRSPDNTTDDNWDDDFTSAISPSALQLPHLRPHDNFGGMLSSEKLKAYASFETVTEETNWDDNFEGDLTMKIPPQLAESDPLQTIRAYNPRHADTNQTKSNGATRPSDQKRSPLGSRRTKTASNLQQKQYLAKQRTRLPSNKTDREILNESHASSTEAQNTAFDGRVIIAKVCPYAIYRPCYQCSWYERRLIRCHRTFFNLLTYLHRSIRCILQSLEVAYDASSIRQESR